MRMKKIRKPTAKPTVWHKDKSKYTRKVKHRDGEDNSAKDE